ncbi:MAG: hotdog fold thioesterase, partial [Bacteroidota bacterium]
MAIWFDKEITVDQLKPIGNNTMAEWLGIEWLEVGDNFLKARMPVDHRTTQDYGILHGGASCVLAETIGSIGSYLVIDHTKFFCVGLEINANHIRTVREARPDDPVG